MVIRPLLLVGFSCNLLLVDQEDIVSHAAIFFRVKKGPVGKVGTSSFVRSSLMRMYTRVSVSFSLSYVLFFPWFCAFLLFSVLFFPPFFVCLFFRF